MPMQDTPETDTSPTALPKRTTPTWEMELLLSGATVFAMFQATQAMTEWGSGLIPRLAENPRMIFGVLFTYGNSALTLLTMTFALHLMLRAWWVALVGVDSVYPGGPRFERLRGGPIHRALMIRRWKPIPERVEATDNLATTVFALGISLAMILVPISVLVSVLFLLAMLVGWMLDRPDDTATLFALLSAATFLPLLLAAIVDKQRGDKLASDSWLRRACERTLGFYSRVGMGRDSNPMVAVFQTHVGERKGMAVVFVVMLAGMLGSTAGLALTRNQFGLGSYAAFPTPQRGMADSVDGRNYASMHEPGVIPASPFVPAPVAKGDYLALVVPYVPALHGRLFAECKGDAPENEHDADERERRRELLACVAAGFTVTLDGQPAPPPQWYADPRRDLRGLLYMLPVATLAPGRHELAVMPPKPGDERAQDEHVTLPWVIPFWR
ncbi:MAG TPA: hypothetical protein DC063_13780 [Arenimonas sp.]|nr:MAG: hypothetical protein A2X76_00075 [Xanthomonadales bacterium GWF1_69_6]HBD21035.1 hypothetical protein [Arenimonas sp.]